MISNAARAGAVTAGVLVLAGIVAVNVIHDSHAKVSVQTQKVGRRDLVSVVSASGAIKPKRFVDVSANVSGRITVLKIKEGDTVKRGQVLARIDSTRFEAGERQGTAGVQAARADLERSLADLEAAQLAFERTKRMHAEKLVADQTFEQAQADLKMKTSAVEAQRRRINQQEAMLATSRDDLEKTTVVAPMDGVVTNLQKEEGEVVIGAQSFQPTVIMTVGDLSVMEVEVLVDETDIRKVELGETAEVRVDALEGVKIKGEVTEIGSSAIPRGSAAAGASAASTANQAKDFKVTVTLQDPPPTLRPGLNATADITTARRAKVLAIPIQAVVVREVDGQGKVIDPSLGQPTEGEPAAPKTKGEEKEGVFVVNRGKAVFQAVKTGIMGETEIEILGGVKDADEVVIGSYRTLRTLKDQSRIKAEKKERNS